MLYYFRLGERKFLLKRAVSVIALIMILVSMFTLAFDIQQASANGGTGFEPWYYYIKDVINSASGNLFFSTDDISIRARGFDIAIVRTYNSHHSNIDGPFGLGWTHNFNVHLMDYHNGSVAEFDEDGSIHTFTYFGANKYSSPPGINVRLRNVTDGFVLMFKDGMRYDFASDGMLLRVTDKNDNNLTMNYQDMKLASVCDDSGLQLTFSYVGSRISTVVDPLGRVIHYEYDAGRLARVVDAMGNSTLYFYYDNSKLRSVVDRVGRMLTFSYYGNGKVKDVFSSLYEYYGKSYLNPFKACQVQYGENVAYATNARGYTTEIEMNEFGNPVRIVDPTGNFTLMGWDSNMNMVSMTDPNNYTYAYRYDLDGNLLNRTDPTGNVSRFSWWYTDAPTRFIIKLYIVENELHRQTRYYYDSNDNLDRVRDATWNYSYYSYDSYGHVVRADDLRGYSTNYTYNIHGFMINCTDATGNVTRFGYDMVGRLTSVTDANGHTTVYEYDHNDRRIREIDATGNVTSYNYNAEGELLSTIDANGHQTSYRKNILGETDTTTDASDNATFYRYDREKNLVKETDARGYTTTYTYDPLNRLISTTDALGNTESYTYDGVGNRLSLTDKNGHTTTYEYDPLNRLTKMRDALGCEVKYEYDAVGNRLSITDENGHTTRYEYDALNRLIETTNPAGNEARYSYDPVGNRIRTTDARGFETDYEYDPLNRLISVTDALGNIERYSYDAVGNRLSLTDKNGHATTYAYDTLDRLIRTTCPLGYETDYEYDAVGNRIKEIDGNDHETEYEYDALNRLIRTTDALGYETKYEYDSVGNRLSVTDANSHKTRYEYDALHRIAKITRPSGNATEFHYDAVGNLMAKINAKGQSAFYEYDVVGRLAQTSYPDGSSVTYTYDSVGNILQIQNTGGLGDITYYEYDELDRITSFTLDYGPFTKTVSYTYDEVGNRLTMIDQDSALTNYEYDPLNRLIRITDALGNDTIYGYDSVGNRLEMSYPNGINTTYVYDEANRLINVISLNSTGDIISSYGYEYDGVGLVMVTIKNNESIGIYQYDASDRLVMVTRFPSESITEYTYDPVGNRLAKLENGAETTYTYDEDDRLLSVLSLTENALDDYIWLASFPEGGLTNNGLPGRTVGTDNPYNGFGVPYWTGNFSLTYPVESVNSIKCTYLPFTADEYTLTLTEGVDYIVHPDEDKIELLVPQDVDIINEHWVDGVNNSLNGWPWINYVASGISAVYVSMPNGTSRPSPNAGYMGPPPGEWWYDPDYPWELEGWWALGYFPGPWNWPVGSEWWINYTAAPYLTIDYNVDGAHTLYLYDNDCNRALACYSDGTILEHEYDFENRLVNTTFNYDGDYDYSAYYYTPEGKRIAKGYPTEEMEGRTFYVYDRSEIIAELNSTGSTLVTFVPDVSATAYGYRSYIHSNGFDTTTMWTNDWGEIEATLELDEFGNILEETGWPTKDTIQFRGMQYDWETGFYRDGCRYVDPTVWKSLCCDWNPGLYAFTCCCCVEDVKIQNVKATGRGTPNPTPGLFGHSFDTVIDLEYKVSIIFADCTLEWWEKTNNPPDWQRRAVPPIKPDEWNDLYAHPVTKPSFANSWDARKKPCPGKETVIDTDPPSLQDRGTHQRTLYFEIRVESAPSCDCTWDFITVFATQILEIKDGRITQRDFDTGIPINQLRQGALR